MSGTNPTAGLPPQPDPPKDRPGKPLPQNIADLLTVLHILVGYGAHLAETLERRAAARTFSAIAQFFGTARVPAIRARLARGLLRCMALERVLLARAARGRDLVFYKPRAPRTRAAQVPGAQAANIAATNPPRHTSGPRPDPDAVPDPDALPTLEQLEAEIRRRPIGRAIADICADLGVSPSLCERTMWLALFEAIMWYHGNLPKLMKTFRRREIRFCDVEADRNPAIDWPERSRDGIRRILGFFVGEPSASPPLRSALSLPQPAVARPP